MHLDPYTWVFAYGSNMDRVDLHHWLHSHTLSLDGVSRVKPGLLANHRLVWNYHSASRDGGAANVEVAVDHQVPGLALEVSPSMLGALDLKEGHPHRYCRGDSPRWVDLLSGGHLHAWVYSVRPPLLADTFVWPRRAYLTLMIRAARRYGFPAWYLRQLEHTPTVD